MACKGGGIAINALAVRIRVRAGNGNWSLAN